MFAHSLIQLIFIGHLFCLGPLLGTAGTMVNKTKTSAAVFIPEELGETGNKLIKEQRHFGMHP